MTQGTDAAAGPVTPARIPLSEAASTADYRRVPVDRGHPLFDEPLVDLRSRGIACTSWYHRDDGENPPYGVRIAGSIPQLLVRRSLVEPLLAADRVLKPYGVALLVVDAWRPLAVQVALFDFFTRRMAEAAPHLPPHELRTRVRTYVSDPAGFDPDDPRTWPTHSTGAAVDVLLIDRAGGAEIDLGAPFDDMGPAAHSDHFERLLDRGAVRPDDPRLLNRRLLHHAMQEAGFVNYPMEFWHFDRGNQMFVANLARTGTPAPAAAWYGYARGPE